MKLTDEEIIAAGERFRQRLEAGLIKRDIDPNSSDEYDEAAEFEHFCDFLDSEAGAVVLKAMKS